MKEIEKYQKEDGSEPFSDWLDELPEDFQVRVFAYVRRVAQGGAKKSIELIQGGNGVKEIRIHFGPGYRVYFGDTTMKRRKSFNEELSQKLKKPKFFRSYIESLIEAEDGELSYEDALRDAIDVMGIREFAKLVGLPEQRVHEFLNGKEVKPETLNRFLKPFKLKTKIVFEAVA